MLSTTLINRQSIQSLQQSICYNKAFVTTEHFCFYIKDREGTCTNVLKSIGINGHLIHPFDNLNMIAGQGQGADRVLNNSDILRKPNSVFFLLIIPHEK